jgi:hypothetical protein
VRVCPIRFCISYPFCGAEQNHFKKLPPPSPRGARTARLAHPLAGPGCRRHLVYQLLGVAAFCPAREPICLISVLHIQLVSNVTSPLLSSQAPPVSVEGRPRPAGSTASGARLGAGPYCCLASRSTAVACYRTGHIQKLLNIVIFIPINNFIPQKVPSRPKSRHPSCCQAAEPHGWSLRAQIYAVYKS